MRQIRNWTSRMSIRKKLVFYSYAIITPILLLISILLLVHNYRSAVKSEEERCIQNVRNISDSIHVLQSDMKEMGTYISINDEIKKILTSDEPEVLNRDSRLWQNRAPMQMIQDMIVISGQIKSIAVYPENGVNPYLNCIDRSSSYLGNMEQVRDQEIYKLAVQEKGKFLWQRIGHGQTDTYQVNQNDKIVMYREIYDMARKHKLGYLVIGSSAELYDGICRNSLQGKQESVVVMSEYGAELVRCGDIDDALVSEIIAQKSSEPMGREVLQKSSWEGYHIYRCRNEETGTMIYEIVQRVGWRDMSNTILLAPLALLVGFLIGLYPVLRVVSDIVSKPLYSLRVAMEKFMQGDFSQKVEVMTQDEVGEASACFNRMVDDIRELIDKNYILAIKERESELDTLQAQINPHFLYNTLDSLYWKATESGNDEIAEDILSLSQLFRLVLNRGNGIVTVRTEAELLERYLQIQKMRFGKRLTYEISLEPEILEEKIPKLILQPFVENAIVHGFESADGSYTLAVRGRKEKHDMIFRITDTGVGMSKEQLDAIWDQADTRKYASQRIGRYAIKNVKERLELMYRENYELHIESGIGKGTTVVIKVPCGLEESRNNEN